ncbi:hypothetical protein NC651_027042 [Populus alba x Populus x berolinensis]|nr:hypothetical protein NC651_027042 [Populus alba x Populus x berolinensis]
MVVTFDCCSTTFSLTLAQYLWLTELFICLQHEEGVEERARDYNAIWMSAVEILDGDIYLGAKNNFNLFTVRKNSEGAAEEERGCLEVLGEYHIGEFINRFRHGSLVMHLTDSDGGQIPTAIFGTVNAINRSKGGEQGPCPPCKTF